MAIVVGHQPPAMTAGMMAYRAGRGARAERQLDRQLQAHQMRVQEELQRAQLDARYEQLYAQIYQQEAQREWQTQEAAAQRAHQQSQLILQFEASDAGQQLQRAAAAEEQLTQMLGSGQFILPPGAQREMEKYQQQLQAIRMDDRFTPIQRARAESIVMGRIADLRRQVVPNPEPPVPKEEAFERDVLEVDDGYFVRHPETGEWRFQRRPTQPDPEQAARQQRIELMQEVGEFRSSTYQSAFDRYFNVLYVPQREFDDEGVMREVYPDLTETREKAARMALQEAEQAVRLRYGDTGVGEPMRTTDADQERMDRIVSQIPPESMDRVRQLVAQARQLEQEQPPGYEAMLRPIHQKLRQEIGQHVSHEDMTFLLQQRTGRQPVVREREDVEEMPAMSPEKAARTVGDWRTGRVYTFPEGMEPRLPEVPEEIDLSGEQRAIIREMQRLRGIEPEIGDEIQNLGKRYQAAGTHAERMNTLQDLTQRLMDYDVDQDTIRAFTRYLQHTSKAREPLPPPTEREVEDVSEREPAARPETVRPETVEKPPLVRARTLKAEGKEDEARAAYVEAIRSLPIEEQDNLVEELTGVQKPVIEMGAMGRRDHQGIYAFIQDLGPEALARELEDRKHEPGITLGGRRPRDLENYERLQREIDDHLRRYEQTGDAEEMVKAIRAVDRLSKLLPDPLRRELMRSFEVARRNFDFTFPDRPAGLAHLRWREVRTRMIREIQRGNIDLGVVDAVFPQHTDAE